MMRFTRQLQFMMVGAAVFLLGACDVEQVDEGELPEIDVEVEGGELPEYDVDMPEVDIRSNTDTVVVETPEVEIHLPEDTEE